MTPISHVVHVAVAVIENVAGDILIAKRPLDTHQGGLWEFPGGKVEQGERVVNALKRELHEELGIQVNLATPLIRIPHDYADKSVVLDVWRVQQYDGQAHGNEGQPIQWVNPNQLLNYAFPAANQPIIQAVTLPDKYMISGDFKDEQELITLINAALQRGIKLIQFRAHNLEPEQYFEYAKNIYSLCEEEKAQFLLNTSVEQYLKYTAYEFSHGLHLTSSEINRFTVTDFPKDLLFAASVHNQHELDIAQKKKLNFCVLSPVNKTSSHPDATPIGWKKFLQLTESATLPVYALGGMNEDDIITAKEHGGQGISAIGAFWHV